MTDLEYAAKAAGIDGQLEGDGWFINNADGLQWNPEEDEGDSRRLQVKLRLSIHLSIDVVQVDLPSFNSGVFKDIEFNPAIEGDDLRACREAVFQVAVQIGRNMK